ncbi:uncharacterized protein LOC144568098 [Carex rostrata]
MSTGNEDIRFENLQRERDRMANELQRLRAAAVERENNEAADANRPLRDFTAPRAEEIHLGYTTPTINAEEYQIPPAWVSMVQRNLFHGLPHEDATQHLMPQDKGMLDAAAEGSLMNKGAVDGYKLVDDMALNQSQWHNPRETPMILQWGLKEVNSNPNLAAEIAALNRKIDQMSVNSVNNSSPLPCSICGNTDHLAINCGISNWGSFEEVNAINQVAQQASSSFRQQGTLLGKSDINLREYANAITLRSGMEYQGPKMLETQPPSARLNANTPASDLSQESGNSNPAKVKSIETPKYIPPLRFVPFPQMLVKNKLDQQEILTKKRTMEESKHVILDEKCSAIFSTDLPPKMKDPGSFSIPCSIDTTRIENAMCDLGASVNLMPKSVYDKLELGNLEPTNMTLTLTDGMTRSPLGIFKNVVVKIGKIKIPADFVVIETDDHSAVLLG